MNICKQFVVTASLLLIAGPAFSDIQVAIPQGVDGGSATTQDVGSPEPVQRKDPERTKVTRGIRLLYEEHQAYLQAKADGQPVGEFLSEQSMAMLDGESVVVDASASGDPQALAAKFESLGMDPVYTFGRMVSGVIPITALPEAEALSELKFMRLSAAYRNVGAVTSQGDAAMRTDDVRAAFGLDGSGVTVGVLSDSYDCTGVAPDAADDVASGDLPATVTVLSDLGSGCIDEGRAMLQLVHDVAPGADLAFASAFIGGQAGFANAILDLADPLGPDADVIVDDIIYFAEPMFQDGVIAQAADAVNRARKVYFSSAGNNDREGYQAPFVSSGIAGPVGGDLHDFDPGAGTDTRLTITQTSDTFYVFNWQDPFFSVSGGTGALNDIDVCFYFPVGATDPFACFTDINTGGDAIELGEITGAGDLEISIELFDGPDPGLIQLVTLGSISFAESYDGVDATTSYGHANAAGAIAVGAAPYFGTPDFGVSPPRLEDFSSAGGTPILFDLDGDPQNILRQKPEITAPDGTDTTFFGQDIEPNGFPNFFGTSAAAPHAAAMAALILEKDPILTPWQIRQALKLSSVDILQTASGSPTGSGFEFDSGSGLIEGPEAVRAAGGVFERVLVVPDQNGNDSPEIIVMVVRSDNDRIRILAKDSDTDVTIWSNLLPPGFTPRGVAALGTDHLLVERQRDSDGRAQVMTLALLDGAILHSRLLPPGYSVAAFTGLGTDLVATLRQEDATGTLIMEARDAFTGAQLKSTLLGSGMVVRGMEPISATEVAVLSWSSGSGVASLEVWDVLSGIQTGATIAFSATYVPLGLATLDGTDVCVLLYQLSNERPRLRCHDAFAGTLLADRVLLDGAIPLGIQSAGPDHVSVNLLRLEDGASIVHNRDPQGGAFISNLIASSGFDIWQHAAMQDVNTNGAPEIVLLRVRVTDRFLTLQIRDTSLLSALNIVPLSDRLFEIPEQ